MSTYDLLKMSIRLLGRAGRLPESPTREQRIDWAYGSAVIENPKVTREMVARAVDASSK